MRLPQWLKVQRISLFLFLVSGVLLLIYALGFISDVYIFYAYGSKGLVDFYHEMQEINAGLLWKALALIIFAAVLFMLELGKHPAGIITLVVVALVSAASIFFSAETFVLLVAAREEYSALDLTPLNRYIERGAIKYQFSTLTYDLGLGGYVLLLLSSLFMLGIVMRNAFTVREVVVYKKDGK